MTRNIKITERQYQMLENLNEEEYTYLDNDDNTKPYTGNYEISPEGKKSDGITPPEKRVKTDDVGIKLTPQSWVAHNVHNRAFATMLREMDTNDADDIGETDAFDYIAKMKERIEIPRLVQERIKLLLASTQGLNVNQFAVILYDLINDFTSQSTNNQSRRVFDSLLREFQKRTGLSRTLEKELENAD